MKVKRIKQPPAILLEADTPYDRELIASLLADAPEHPDDPELRLIGVLATERRRGSAGYVVAVDLAEQLFAQLNERLVQYVHVTEPIKLGEYPRPVLVSNDPAPRGWKRARRCRECRGLVPLGAAGDVTASRWCGVCNAARQRFWPVIEGAAPAISVQPPKGVSEWPEGIHTVTDLRDALAAGRIQGVGPEREHLVSEALAAWRESVLEQLQSAE